MTKQQDHNQAFMLADNFPAKTFLLVAHLSETDPEVSSFSSDGTSFEIYDQSIFAQKYLPQYFKHSNYGSFVRQLNLYGFTSSRLKNNNQVVVWSHHYFRRDRKDLVKKIKRTKKTKRSKPCSPSPPSVIPERSEVRRSSLPEGAYLEISAGGPRSSQGCPPLSYGDDVPSNGYTHAQSSYKMSGKGSGIDHTWLESEFAYLKQQNKFLEQKLDMLLKITLQMSPLSLEEMQLGEKRRRMSVLHNGEHVIPVETSIHIHHNGLGSIHEEQKLFYGDEYDIDPTPCERYRKTHQAPYGGNRKIPLTAYGVDDNIPCEGRRIMPPITMQEAGGHDFGTMTDSLKGFVDIMLTKDEQEKCKEVEGPVVENNHSANPYAVGAPANINSSENGNPTPLSPDTNSQGGLYYEEMEEAMHTRASLAAGGELFSSSDDPETCSARIPDQSEAHQPHPTHLVTTANAAVDKADGPQPIQSTSLEIPAVQSGDIEECNVAVGMVVVAAEAELVEDSRDGTANGSNKNFHRIEQEGQEFEQSQRKKVLYLLAFMSIVLAVGVTWPAVALTKNNQKKIPGLGQKHLSSDDNPGPGGPHPFPPPCPEGAVNETHGGCLYHNSHNIKDRLDLGWKDPGDAEESDEGKAVNEMQESLKNNDEDLLQDTKQALRLSSDAGDHTRSSGRTKSKGKRISNPFDYGSDEIPKINYLSITFEGTEFTCSQGETP